MKKAPRATKPTRDTVAVPPALAGDFRFLGAYALPEGLEPSDPRLRRAGALLRSGDETGARTELEEAARRSPRLVSPRLLLGALRARSGDDAGALAALDEAAALAPRAAGVWILRVEPLLRLGRDADAVESAHAALDAHPEAHDGFVRLLYALEGLKAAEDRGGESEILLAAAKRAAAARPGEGWPWAVYAALAGRSPLQLEPLARSLRAEDGRAWVWAFRGRALGDDEVQDRAGRRRREAEAALTRALRLAPEAGWIACWRAEVRGKLGRKAAARADLDLGLRLMPDYHLARAWRARLRGEAGDLRGALEDLDACWEHTRRVPFLERRAATRAKLGDAAGALADAAECARVSASHALRWGPRAWADDLRRLPHEAPRALGKARWRWRRWLRAGRPAEGPGLAERRGAPPWRPSEEDLARAARAGGGWDALWRGRALLDAGRAAEAASALDRAVRETGAFAAFLWRAEARAGTGDARGALADLDKALALSPRSPVAHASRALARLSLGRSAEAAEDLAAAAAADPVNAGLLGPWLRAAGAPPRARRPRPGAPGADAAAEFELRLGLWPAAERLARRGSGARAAAVRGWAAAARARAGEAARAFDAAVEADAAGTAARLTRFLRELPALPVAGAARVYAALARADGRLGRWEDRARHAALARRLGGAAAVAALGREVPPPARRAEKAAGLARAGRAARAWAEMSRALSEDPTAACAAEVLAAGGRPAPWALAWRGAAARARGDLDAAARDLAAAARGGGPFWAAAWLGELELSRGAAARALAPLDRALRAHPRWAQALTWRGRAACETGACARAEADLRRAVALAPKDPWPALALGVCLEKRGRPEAAKWLARGRALAGA